MTQTAVPPATREAAPTPLRRMRLWAAAHAVDDMYQGLVPAVVPYFVLDRGYGYVAATGLTLAAAIGASIPQPFIGLLVDRRRLNWFAPAFGLIAEHHGPEGVFTVLCAVPLAAVVLGLFLKRP